MVVTTMGYPALEVGHDRSLADKPPPRPHPRGHREGAPGQEDVDEIVSAVRNSHPPGSSSRWRGT